MKRWRALQVLFGQWKQRVWFARFDDAVKRAEHADKRAEWWQRWTHRRLP